MKKKPTRYVIAIAASTLLLSSQWVVAGDPQKGQEKSVVCQGCHGPDGNSLGPDWPNLASQNATYIQKQVADFQAGKRKDPTMSTMVVAHYNQYGCQLIPIWLPSRQPIQRGHSKAGFP